MLRLLSSVALFGLISSAVAACGSNGTTGVSTSREGFTDLPPTGELGLLDAPGLPDGEGDPPGGGGVRDVGCTWKCQCEAPPLVFPAGTDCNVCQALIDGINAQQGCGAGGQPRFICQPSSTQVNCIVRCADLADTSDRAASCDLCTNKASASCGARDCKLGLLGNSAKQVIRTSACGN